MIIERIEELCEQNNITITALCIEITGSSGNLATWKKDNIKPIWLISICQKFGVSADYILTGISSLSDTSKLLTFKEYELIEGFRKLPEDAKEEFIDILDVKLKHTQKLTKKNI